MPSFFCCGTGVNLLKQGVLNNKEAMPALKRYPLGIQMGKQVILGGLFVWSQQQIKQTFPHTRS